MKIGRQLVQTFPSWVSKNEQLWLCRCCSGEQNVRVGTAIDSRTMRHTYCAHYALVLESSEAGMLEITPEVEANALVVVLVIWVKKIVAGEFMLVYTTRTSGLPCMLRSACRSFMATAAAN